MKFDKAIQDAIALAWNQQSAQSSLERWQEISKREKWKENSKQMPLLIKIFGASWYFTRFLFYRGEYVADLIDRSHGQKFSRPDMHSYLNTAVSGNDIEQQFIKLRLLNNELMLQILIKYLESEREQKSTELALTNLALETLITALTIHNLGEGSDFRLAVLGMGRMAGAEMTFGSDLDLIFLFEHSNDEELAALSRKIRLLLRNLSEVAAEGILYDVDMRLRPHGTSGALLTTTRSFIEYHKENREIWERQMMTRCLPVMDSKHLGQESLQHILPYIYTDYDDDHLKNEIKSMRHRVEIEKGSPKDKYDIKRGRGGIMDIDFLCHYLQLSNGKQYPELLTCSTRNVLTVLAEKKLLGHKIAGVLLDAYDFLKRAEASLRLFDMKPISVFSTHPQEHVALARAMGYMKPGPGFLQHYLSVTDSVRENFNKIVGNPDKATDS